MDRRLRRVLRSVDIVWVVYASSMSSVGRVLRFRGCDDEVPDVLAWKVCLVCFISLNLATFIG